MPLVHCLRFVVGVGQGVEPRSVKPIRKRAVNAGSHAVRHAGFDAAEVERQAANGGPIKIPAAVDTSRVV